MSELSSIHVAQEHKFDQDRLRERQQRQKWHLGEAPPTAGHPSRRPNKPILKFSGYRGRREVAYGESDKPLLVGRTHRKKVAHQDHDGNVDEDADVQGAFRGIVSDADYTYSYDNPGAGKGSQILGQAVATAVEKYETKKTEKLVKDEYEIVPHEKEDSGSGSSGTDDGDFELL